MVYNLMTCEGSSWTMSILGGCSMAWLCIAILFFLTIILRRQCDDGILAGQSFNFIGALIGGLGVAVLLITLTGSARWALLAGIAGIAAGGFLVGMFIGGESGGSE